MASSQKSRKTGRCSQGGKAWGVVAGVPEKAWGWSLGLEERLGSGCWVLDIRSAPRRPRPSSACSPTVLLETSPLALHVAIPRSLSASSLIAPRQGAAPYSQHPMRTLGRLPHPQALAQATAQGEY